MVSVALKNKGETVPVVDTPLKISMRIRNTTVQNNEIACGWWDHTQDELVTTDCSATWTNGSVTCHCSHLTNFMSIYKDKISDHFKDGNWGTFSSQK